MIYLRPKPLWLLGVMILAPLWGCDGNDPERLKRLSQKAYEKIREQTIVKQAGLSEPAESVRQSLQGPNLASKVSARIRWDKDMQGAKIDVKAASKDTVELRGRVRDLAQRQKAVQLAKSTLGVRDVVDALIENQGP